MRWSSQLQVAPVLGRAKFGYAHKKQEIFPANKCNRRPKRRRVLRRDGKRCVFSACYLSLCINSHTMTRYSNLNSLTRRRTDMGDNNREVPLSDNSLALELSAKSEAAAYFRDLETPLLSHIGEADAVVGCVAWLTNHKVLTALASKRSASIILQKEDFLRPDLEPLKEDWRSELRTLYDAICPIRAPGHWAAGWLEVRTSEDSVGLGAPLGKR